jgi:uncharacterized protein (TIRG00374 family)
VRWALSKWGRAVLGALIAAVFVSLIVRRLDWRAVRLAWGQVTPAAMLLALAFLAAGLTVRIVRWWWMLRADDPSLPLGACVRPFLGSLALNNTVPFRAGDAVRAFGFRGTLRTPAAQIVGTLVIERVLDMLVLLTLFFVGLLGMTRGSSVPRSLVTAGTALFAASLGGILLLVLAPRRVEALVARVLGAGPLARSGVAERLRSAAGQFFGTFERVLTPWRAPQLVLMSVAAWGLEGGMYAVVAHAIHAGGRPFGPFFSLATGTLATLIPSSPGYVGTFDYFAALGLTAYGAGRDAAGAFALLVHLALWLPPTVVGALCLAAPGRRDATGQQRTPDRLATAAPSNT